MTEHFFLRLNPPRPTFSADMSDEEREMMGRHVAYWSERLANGDLVAFGPVADPEGGYGIAIAKADGEDESLEDDRGRPGGDRR